MLSFRFTTTSIKLSLVLCSNVSGQVGKDSTKSKLFENVLKVSLFTSSYIFERTANYFINFLKNRLPRKIITSVGLNAYAQLSVTEVLSKDDVSPSFLILFIFLKRLEKIRSLFHCLLSSHFDL